MGNSEVGQLGAGRIVYQDLTRINKALAAGELAHNAALQDSFQKARNHRLHLLGLVSDGGVRVLDSSWRWPKPPTRGAKEIFVHAFTDGRDASPNRGGGIFCANAKRLCLKAVRRL